MHSLSNHKEAVSIETARGKLVRQGYGTWKADEVEEYIHSLGGLKLLKSMDR